MRIKAITPIRITEEELARRTARYASLSPSNVELDLVNLPDTAGIPYSLESTDDIRSSEKYVVEEALNTDPAAYDAVLPDCVLDTGLERIEREARVPAFGLLKLSAGYLISVGHRFAAFTRNHPIGEELNSRLRRYGFDGYFEGVSVLDLDFADISDESRWNLSLEEAIVGLASSPATAVINGCSASNVRHGSDSPVAIVDPPALALSLIGLAKSAALTPPPGTASAARTG